MTIAIARRIGATLDIKSETKIRTLNDALLEYVRLTQQSPTTPVTGPPSAASKELTIVTVTATSRTMGAEDVNLVDDDTAGSEVTITLPPASDAQYPRYIKKLGTTANVVIDGNGTETIDGELTATIIIPFTTIMLISDGANWHIL